MLSKNPTITINPRRRNLRRNKQEQIKVLYEQTRELTDDLHDFLDYV